MVKHYISFLILLLSGISLVAQVAWLTPSDPSPVDTVTLTYDSKQGNKGLADWDGTVYLHTGAITAKSIDGGDWKHVTGNWGEDDPQVRMKAIGNGLHEFTFVINDYYQLREEEVIQQLAFVFRNADGSKVGKTARNEDIFLPVNGYIPPVKAPPKYLFEERKYLSHEKTAGSLIITTDQGMVEILPYTPKIIQVKHHENGITPKDSSDAVIYEPTIIPTSLKEELNLLIYATDSLEMIIHKTPFRIFHVYNNDTVLKESNGYFQRTDNHGLRFELEPEENIFGLGERAIDFSLRGYKYNLYNRPKYGYEFPTLNLNYSVPLVVSSNKYLLYFDNPQKGYADIGETEKDILEWGAIGGLMKYFVIVGHDYYNIMQQWGKLTGTQPLPPRWALGNLQSRMAYRTQVETDSIVSLMQEKDFPIDAIILDFYWFGDSILGTMGRLKWYKPNWPEPEKMIEKFRSKGVKTVLITEPYILDTLENFFIADELGILATDSLGQTYVNKGFYFGHGALIDMFMPEAREWFWKQYDKQIKKGVAGWWGDLGEPENHPSDQYHINGSADEVHNIYAHYWHKMLFENYRENYPADRLFNLNRAGYAGSQRYSIYPWTGDVARSWGGLKAQIPTMLHMSMSGLPFIHSDAGGFAQGSKDEELYTRWLQMSCFSPILRPHGSGIPSEPVYFNEETQDIVRNFMQWRYRLLPYIYTTAAQAKLRGYPITRPIFFDYPGDSVTYRLGNQYMFGPSMLVAPVIERGLDTIAFYLPEGKWYDFWINSEKNGGNWIRKATNPESIPVFVRKGSFIPMVEAVNSTDDYSTKHLTVRYYMGQPGDTAAYNMFEDDGKTFGSIERGEFEVLRFKANHQNEKYFSISMIKDGWEYNGMPGRRTMNLEIVGLDENGNYHIAINDEKIKRKKKNNKYPQFHFDESGIMHVEFHWDGSFTNIKVQNL